MAFHSHASTLPPLCFEGGHQQPPDSASLAQNAVSGPITPPESPIEAFLPRPDTPKDNKFVMSTSPNSGSVGSSSPYPLAQAQVMALVLAEARASGEFPTTTASAMDFNAMVEDYQALTQLRGLRGDLSHPAPEAYRHFRVEVARRINERDGCLDEEAKQGEVTRRVNTYLQAVAQEQRYFDTANTPPLHREIVHPTQLDLANANEEICSVVEQSIEQGIADATGPLRMNVGKLDTHAAGLKHQTEVMGLRAEAMGLQADAMGLQAGAMGRQIELHHQIVAQQLASISALQAMHGPQAQNIQATTQNLAMTHGLVNHLSQLVTNLPGAINQSIHTAVQHQAQASLANVLEIQRQAMADIEHRTQRLNDLQRQVEAHSASQGPRQRMKSGALHQAKAGMDAAYF
ncbi:hypothetical protein ACJ41O_004683 [Fusarium nematophilum]